MKLLGSSSFITTVAVALTAVFVVGAACGKDKPAEEAPTEAPAATGDEGGDKPAEGEADEAKAGEDAGGNTDEAPAEAGTRADPKEVADDPKARLRAARDRPGRRPVPVRSLRDGAERPPRGGDEDGPGVGEPGEPTPDPTEPEPSPPVVAEGPSEPTLAEPTPAEPTPAEPTPAEPTPADAPAVNPGAGYEIRNDAAALDAAKMMPLVAVTEIIGKQLAAGVPLQGIALVAGYGSIFYASPEATKFGVALQAWQDPTRRESEDRFRRMRLQYPNAEDISALLPSKGFYAYFGGVQSLTWVEPTKRMVLSVSCGEGLCSHDQLVRLAKSTRERM